MSIRLRIKQIKKQWYVQKPGWFRWSTISKGFDNRQLARDYAHGLRDLARIEKLFKSYYTEGLER